MSIDITKRVKSIATKHGLKMAEDLVTEFVEEGYPEIAHIAKGIIQSVREISDGRQFKGELKQAETNIVTVKDVVPVEPSKKTQTEVI